MKRKALRIPALLLTLALALTLLGGCTDSGSSEGSSGRSAKAVEDKALYDKGIELIEKMSAQADSLRKLLKKADGSGSEGIATIMKEIASVKPEKAKIYSIKGYTDDLLEALEDELGVTVKKGDEEYGFLLDKLQATQISTLLSLTIYEANYYGSGSVAMASTYQIMNVSDVFPGKLEEPVAFLYHMKSSGSVLVSFVPAGLNKDYVSATAVYLPSSALKEAGSKSDVQDYIDRIFSYMGDMYQYKVSKVDVE